MDAMVTVEFKYENVCDVKDLEDISFTALVKDLISEDGISSAIDDYSITNVKMITKGDNNEN